MRARLITFILLVFVGGCGQQPQPEMLGPESVRLLLVADPFGLAIDRYRRELESQIGVGVEIELVGYNDVRRLALSNAASNSQAYDLISFDVVWLGEYVERGVLDPLDDAFAAGCERNGFLKQALRDCMAGDTTYGFPIQPHSELLWYRADLFEAAGLGVPQTTTELLAAARRMTDGAAERYGIAWNGARGQALGQTVAHTLAAFGHHVLDDTGRPVLTGPEVAAALGFLRELLACSPPDVLTMAWDQRIAAFGAGRVAMTYGWGGRAFTVTGMPAGDPAREHVRFAPPPTAPGAPHVVPLGTWSLGLAPGLPDARRERALDVMRRLCGDDGARELVRYGNGGPSRTAVLSDASMAALNPVFPLMAELDDAGVLQSWMRPAVPEWSELCEIMGTVFHDYLQGRVSLDEAMQLAQVQADALFGVQP